MSELAFGFVTNCLGQTTIDEAVAVAREAGLTCLEIGPTVKRDLPAFQRVVEDGEIKLHSFIYGRNILTEDRSLLETYGRETRRLLDMAILLGVPQVTMAMGMRPSLTLEESIRASLDFWAPFFEEGAAAGVRFALEFCPTSGNFALGPFAWRQLFEQTAVYPNFGLNYDPSHLLWQLIDPYKALADFQSHIFSVHVKDARIDHNLLTEHGILTPYRYQEIAPQGFVEDRAPWWTFAIPGEGDLDWQRFGQLLLDGGYDGALLIELETETYLGSRERVIEGLRRSRDHVQTCLTAIREQQSVSKER